MAAIETLMDMASYALKSGTCACQLLCEKAFRVSGVQSILDPVRLEVSTPISYATFLMHCTEPSSHYYVSGQPISSFVTTRPIPDLHQTSSGQDGFHSELPVA